MRKMASIQRVAEIRPIENSDNLDHYRVNGWWVVDKKGAHQVGDLVVFGEVDSWIPHALAPFLSKGQEPREFNGVKGERLRTVKLRGALSQGLLLPIETGIGGYPFIRSSFGEQVVVREGEDVSEWLGIQKYEPPIPAQLAGLIRGNFPAQGRKTDQERCLSGDTIVTTLDGDVTMKELCENKLESFVKSYNHSTTEIEFRKIIGHSIMTRKSGWVKVTTKSGKEIIMTNNHRVWVEDLMCYRLASELKIGNLLKITQKD